VREQLCGSVQRWQMVGDGLQRPVQVPAARGHGGEGEVSANWGRGMKKAVLTENGRRRCLDEI
jgi:hypothetical protein